MERVIQQTDYDALSCRLSAIEKGYLPSPSLQVEKCHYEFYREMHLEYFHTLKVIDKRVYGKINRTVRSSFPVMNYGTYLRTVSIDLAVNDFLDGHRDTSNVQIINLGCGSDLRMIPLLKNFSNLSYIDVDFENSIDLKSRILWHDQNLRQSLKLHRDEDTSIVSSERYKLVACDLNDLKKTMQKLQAVTNPKYPALVITECALCYMPQKESQALIDEIVKHYESGLWISYDPIGGSQVNDRFGIIMQSNLRDSRQLEMPTLMIYNSKETYSARFSLCEVQINDMWEIFNNIVTSNEAKRLRSLQFLDEIEELKVMQTHYILSKAKW